MKAQDIKRENEKRILKSVAISLWSLIALIITTSFVLREVIETTDFRRLVFEATSLITQIQITSPKYGSLLFLLAFIGKILVLYIIYVLLSILIEAFSKKDYSQKLFEGAYIEGDSIFLPNIDKSIKLNDLSKKTKKADSPKKKISKRKSSTKSRKK